MGGGNSRKARRVWVDGVEFSTERAAAKAAEVSMSSLYEALKYGRVVIHGHSITDKPPKPRGAEPIRESRTPLQLPSGMKRKALLRYPPGETPLELWHRRFSKPNPGKLD